MTLEGRPLPVQDIGMKAERQWRALSASLPVLPGYIVPTCYARPALRAGALALRDRGLPAGRREVLSRPVCASLASSLNSAVPVLSGSFLALSGGTVVVRSSSPLEGDPRWSGAFATVAGVRPDAAELVTAVRSVWASVFAIDPLSRMAAYGLDPGSADLAVLIQPEIRPSCGGTATVVRDAVVRDAVLVAGVRGHPGAMLAGWADGASAWVSVARPSGAIDPPEVVDVRGGADVRGDLPGMIGTAAVLAAADLARAAFKLLGDDAIEWAVAAGQVYLLQSKRSAAAADAAAAPKSAPMPEWAPADGVVRVAGRPAVAGGGGGRLIYLRPHEPLPRDAGDVVVLADRPVPALAPLLFAGRADGGHAGGAGPGGRAGPGVMVRGVITRGGSPACHLAEVARGLGVPMVTSCPVDADAETGWFAAVDGTRGEITLRRLLSRSDLPIRFASVSEQKLSIGYIGVRFTESRGHPEGVRCRF
jgi:hypothetical protein